MLTESQVVHAVCRYLVERDFKVIQSLCETERGIDIKAVSPDGSTAVTVEAKGETSSKDFTSRFGKPFSSGQVMDHVSKAFYSAARDFSTGTRAAVAFPKNQNHLDCVRKILPALRQLQIEVFWILPDETVEIEGHWKILPAS